MILNRNKVTKITLTEKIVLTNRIIRISDKWTSNFRPYQNVMRKTLKVNRFNLLNFLHSPTQSSLVNLFTMVVDKCNNLSHNSLTMACSNRYFKLLHTSCKFNRMDMIWIFILILISHRSMESRMLGKLEIHMIWYRLVIRRSKLKWLVTQMWYKIQDHNLILNKILKRLYPKKLKICFRKKVRKSLQ